MQSIFAVIHRRGRMLGTAAKGSSEPGLETRHRLDFLDEIILMLNRFATELLACWTTVLLSSHSPAWSFLCSSANFPLALPLNPCPPVSAT